MQALRIAIAILICTTLISSCKRDITYDIERSLLVAHHKHTNVQRPTIIKPDLTVDKAYYIQDRILSSLKTLEVPWAGYKILPKAISDKSRPNNTAPIYGRLIKKWVLESGTEINFTGYTNPFVENTVALIITKDVPVDKIRTVDDLKPYVSRIAPAVELSDIRFEAKLDDITGIDLIADNAAIGTIILGTPIPINGLDLDVITVTTTKNGDVIDQAQVANLEDHLWGYLAWLAKELDKRNKPLKAGWFVVTARLIGKSMPAKPGYYEVDYGVLGKLSYNIR